MDQKNLQLNFRKYSQKQNLSTGKVISENITKEEYEEARGNLDDNPFRVEQISFEEAKRLYEFSKLTPQTSEVKSELSETEESGIQIDAQLILALFDALADQNDFLTNYWDNEIQGNKEFKAKLREQKILSLEDFIAARKEGIYKSDEDFLESLGCL